MVTKVVMPKLSLTMKEGTVGRWYKKEGDTVDKGEPIVEILSEKATYDLEAPASGILRKILVEEGLTADVDMALALITAPGEELPEAEAGRVAAVPEAVEEEEKRVLASPAAKRLARELGIDISMVEGSGPEGRVSEGDVRRFVEEKRGVAPKIKDVLPLSGYRKTTAERLSISFKTAPHSTNMMEVDVSEAKRLHERLQVSYTTILVKAVARALTEHSIINAALEGEKIKIFEDVNIGVAVATENGLVVPVIRNADKKSLEEIETALKRLTEKAKQGRLVRDEVTGGTFTISNLGMYGVEFFTPIINPPEAAILGVGRVAEKPVVVNGNVQVRPVLMLSLSYDHRVIDGVPAAQFLSKVKHFIENPEIIVA